MAGYGASKAGSFVLYILGVIIRAVIKSCFGLKFLFIIFYERKNFKILRFFG